jgi:curved DNA-binding protein CbpA
MNSPPSTPARVLQLLREAHVSRRSGHLHVTHGQERRGLSVRDGEIIQGRSDVGGEHLSDILVRHGFVSQGDLDKAVEAALYGRRPLGAVLVELDLIDRGRLEEAVGFHAREILFAALDRHGGMAVFEELESVPEGLAEGDPASRLSTAAILLEAAGRLEDPDVVREALGDVDRKLAPAPDAGLRALSATLTPSDGFVLSRVDGTVSAGDLIGLIPLPPEQTERSLLRLLCAGIVDFAPDRPASRRAAAAGAPAASSPAPASPRAEVSAPDAPGEPSSAPAGRSPEQVRQLILETHESLAQRDHFEVLGVTPAASPAEVRAAYARLARTLHPDACRDPVLADVSEQREAVFVRVCQAFEALRDPEERAAYEAELRRRKPWSTASAGAAPASEGSPSAPALSLEETIAAAEELLRDGRHWEAVDQLEPTLRQAEGALRVRALVALARGCVKNPSWMKRAEGYLQEALREDPERTEAYLLLGDIYRVGNFRARATTMYRKALELQPTNRHALRELAQLETPEAPARGGSLLDFLKKR